MKKLLIISVSAGAGHVRAAEAIKKTAEILHPDLEVRHIDLMDYVPASIKKAIVDTYKLMVTKAPGAWGLLYKKTNDEIRTIRYRKISRIFKHLRLQKFYTLLREYNPDHIICTHAFPGDILSHLPDNVPAPPFSLVVTDYGLHTFWLVPGVSLYFVATDDIKKQIVASHVQDAAHIFKTGIPIQPIFYTEKNIQALKKTYSIPEDERVLLFLAGGQGLVDLGSAIQKIGEHTNEQQTIVAVAGSSEKLYKKLKNLEVPDHIHLHTVGWTDNIDEYMRIADIIVSKPGGITTTECLSLEKHMIAISPIPGQEEENATYLEQTHQGSVAKNTEELVELLNAPLVHKKQNSQTLETSAAAQILDTIISHKQ